MERTAMQETLVAAAWTLAVFLLGGVPVGDLVSRLAGVDIRERGTGNPGAANVYRELGAKYGVLVFLLDVAKGVIASAPLMALGWTEWGAYAAAYAVVVGHMFPLFGSRPGGTGMATAVGAAAGLAPAGLLAGAPLGLVLLAVLRNAGYSGGAVFVGMAALALVWQRDVVTALATLGLGGVTLIKSWFQYGGIRWNPLKRGR